MAWGVGFAVCAAAEAGCEVLLRHEDRLALEVVGEAGRAVFARCDREALVVVGFFEVVAAEPVVADSPVDATAVVVLVSIVADAGASAANASGIPRDNIPAVSRTIRRRVITFPFNPFALMAVWSLVPSCR